EECPVGSVEFCRAWMRAVGISEPGPMDYPAALRDRLGRAVGWWPRYGYVPDGLWVKPVETKAWPAHIKRARWGEVTTGCGVTAEQIERTDAGEQGVWSSPHIDLCAEYRVYVVESVVVGVARYDDDEGEDGAFEHGGAGVTFVARAVHDHAVSGAAPAAYALDVASLREGGLILMEATDAWAIGYYKGTCSQADYARL
ncbi:hypothetical protein B1A_10672, partial [mine drainage metagenome]